MWKYDLFVFIIYFLPIWEIYFKSGMPAKINMTNFQKEMLCIWHQIGKNV